MGTKLIYRPANDEWKGEYLKFKQCQDNCWTIVNNDEELLGHIQLLRVGAWMSWCLTLEVDCYLSASCQDEVREMTKKLNAMRNTLKT